jgi:hypothetical protein
MGCVLRCMTWAWCIGWAWIERDLGIQQEEKSSGGMVSEGLAQRIDKDSMDTRSKRMFNARARKV